MYFASWLLQAHFHFALYCSSENVEVLHQPINNGNCGKSPVDDHYIVAEDFEVQSQ